MRITVVVAFALLLAEVKGLIASTTIEVNSFDLVPFAAFAYKSNGNYVLSAKLSKESEKPEVLLLVIATQNNCKTIGKTCIYEIPEIYDICTTINATEFNGKILEAYPIVIPSTNYTLKKNSSSLSVSAKSWSNYQILFDISLKSFIEYYLVPKIYNCLLYTSDAADE
eukprot:TRINITY_DN7446_c0_g1_i4.p1 TRINITY_DN7446_c0_g1~~TRINITY_DN7446_c0_g1_i4.p1  ORF type:complete len:168 (-),score=33.13 TRINITY_DN7446_c0_g1_i4:49-552(-)